MKILITGANGAFGAAMVRYFSDKGYEVIGSGRQADPPPKLLEFAEYIQLDITSSFKLPQVDAIIHAAAYSDDKAGIEELIKPNVEGTRNVVKAASGCPLLIHVSSSSVYLPEDEPIKENRAGDQDNSALSAYGLSKLYAEQEVYKNRNSGSTYILRPRAFYGVGDTQIVPRMLKFVKGDKLQLPGELRNKLSLTHYENIGHAIECCINQSKSGIHVYNVSDDEVYIMREVLDKLMGAMYDGPLKVKKIPLWLIRFFAKYKIGGITPLLVRAVTKDMVLDISAIKKELKYRPKMNLELALPELAQWVRHIGGPEELRNPKKFLSWDLE